MKDRWSKVWRRGAFVPEVYLLVWAQAKKRRKQKKTEQTTTTTTTKNQILNLRAANALKSRQTIPFMRKQNSIVHYINFLMTESENNNNNNRNSGITRVHKTSFYPSSKERQYSFTGRPTKKEEWKKQELLVEIHPGNSCRKMGGCGDLLEKESFNRWALIGVSVFLIAESGVLILLSIAESNESGSFACYDSGEKKTSDGLRERCYEQSPLVTEAFWLSATELGGSSLGCGTVLKDLTRPDGCPSWGRLMQYKSFTSGTSYSLNTARRVLP